jgi:hypothetical protein
MPVHRLGLAALFNAVISGVGVRTRFFAAQE